MTYGTKMSMFHSSIGSRKEPWLLARAEEAKVAMTAQQEIARNAQSDLAKAKLETEKVEQDAEQAKAALLIIQSEAIQATYLARQEAEQANERLMRETNWFQNEAEKAKLGAMYAIKEAEKDKTESDKANKEAEKAVIFF